MHIKKVLSISIVTMLLLSMIAVAAATPWDGTPDDPTPAVAIWVDPKLTTGLGVGSTFVVDVLVNVTNLYGWQYKLFWNSTMITCTEMQTHGDANPGADLLPGHTSVYVAANDTGTWSGGLKDGLEYHSYAVSATGGVAFAGVDSLCTYEFQVQLAPAEPDPDYVGLLDLQDDLLVDDTATPVAHTTTDGEYIIEAIPLPKPKVGVTPDYVLGVYAENFTIDIVIEPAYPLFPQWDMCGWEAKLYYNTTVLDALECIEGGWFAGFAGPNGTYPICNINDTAGVIHMANLYLGNHTTPSGSGVLMTVKFNATSMYTVPPGIPPHLFPMDLEDVLLVDCASQPIEQAMAPNDGEYEEPYIILGWALDCWTDPYRKLGGSGNSYYTQFTGEGISSPGEDGEWNITECETGWGWEGDDVMWTADAYEPQEFVKLYAYLSYNEWPEQNKIVMFEIYGPCNPYWNISILRTAVTNASGVATINFTIPHPCENLEDIVFGKWICYQAAQVKDPWDENRYAKIEDILFWDVGWKVEILEVETTGEVAVACGEIGVTVFYKNIAQFPSHVIMTFSIFDTLLDPIGELVIEVYCEPAAYCHPTFANVTVWLHIPKWAHVGPGATVYVNAFTGLPMQCGLPYCPEGSATFVITLPP